MNSRATTLLVDGEHPGGRMGTVQTGCTAPLVSDNLTFSLVGHILILIPDITMTTAAHSHSVLDDSSFSPASFSKKRVLLMSPTAVCGS